MKLHCFWKREREEIPTVCFSRDSVCAGDDCFDNSRRLHLDDDARWERIVPLLKEDHFFACVSGNDVVWVMENADGEEILAYYTKADRVVCRSEKAAVAQICSGSRKLHFKYYSSRKNRRTAIESRMDGGSALGLEEEIKLCQTE